MKEKTECAIVCMPGFSPDMLKELTDQLKDFCDSKGLLLIVTDGQIETVSKKQLLEVLKNAS